ncbi:UNVERIFIED_CONTAM: hypothetical protein PYX00_005995 [Menopon gallinae]|uniref:Uncharacterized protein n=1 Tax=Menopon gallinae TaxID=328185 RepID=A0AAW2HU73_9NEOP
MSYYTPIFFKKLKKVPSFAHHQDTNNFIEPVPSPSFKAKFCASEEQQFKLEWGRIQKVVFDLYASFRKSTQEGVQECTKMPKGTLAILHDDIHMLLRSKAGSFVFDFIQRKILPAATEILYESILEGKSEEDNDKNVQNSESKKRFNLDVLLQAWKHFYSHILPDLEMIFAEVSSHSHLSVRSATLLAFRDGIILKFLDDLILVLQDHSKIKRQIFSLRQMLLVLQNASEKYPPSESKLNLEKVVALVVSPYQGYHDLYSGFNDEPVVESNEESIDDLSLLDNISEEDNTSLPLCVRSSPAVETLHDLFALSADRTMQQIRSKGKNKDGRKRSISTSGELFVQSFRR